MASLICRGNEIIGQVPPDQAEIAKVTLDKYCYWACIFTCQKIRLGASVVVLDINSASNLTASGAPIINPILPK